MEFGIEDEEAHEYRSLFGLYVTPVVKIWRHMAARRRAPQTPAE